MSSNQRVRTRLQWIESLAKKSPAIGRMQIENVIKEKELDTLGFNLANSDAHNTLIIRGIEKLLEFQAASPDTIMTLLRDIICNDTYGKFCELAAYDWIMQKWGKITIQISLEATDVLGDNSAVLDGRMDIFNIYFDVKSFGFHGYLASRLKECIGRRKSETGAGGKL